MAEIKVTLKKNDNTDYEIDRFNGLRSIESISQSTPDASVINYGVTYNSGNAKISDFNGDIETMIADETLDVSNIEAKVYFNGNQVQEHLTVDSDYDSVNRQLSLPMNNSLATWQDINYPGYQYPLDEQLRDAYTLLEDVFVNAGYVKENLENWISYQNADAIQKIGSTVTVDTSSGWEIIGTPVKVEPNKSHTIKFKYFTSQYNPLSGYTGIGAQVLSAIPTNSNCSTISIVTVQLENDGASQYQATLTFTPTVSTVYLVLNFGYAEDGQSIIFNGSDFEIDGKSLYRALNKQIIYGDDNRVGTVKSYLENIWIPYPYLKPDTMFNTINKFCQLAQLSVYEDDNGDIVFASARPRITSQEAQNAIEVKTGYQYKQFDRSIILKNKYNTVEMNETKVNEEVDIDRMVSSYSSEKNEEMEFDDIPSEWNQTLVNANSYIRSDTASQSATLGTVTTYVWTTTNAIFLDSSISFNRFSNNNLIKILSVLSKLAADGTPNIKYSVNYRKFTGTTQVVITNDGPQFIDTYNDDFTIGSQSLATYSTITTTYPAFPDATSSVTDETNLKTTNVTLSGGVYSCNTVVLAGYESKKYNYIIDGQSITSSGTCEKYVPISVDITFNGTKKTIVFNEQSAGDLVTKSSIIAKVPSNELIQEGTVYHQTDTKISDVIKNNIKNDYVKGISNGTSTVSCANYYDANQTIKKNWNNGEILKVGDIVRMYDSKSPLISYPDNSPMYWRVTGRKARYSGCPYVDLELQEVKII